MRTLATFALFASLYSFIFVSHQFIIFPVSPRAVVECRSGWPAPPASPGIQSMLQSGLPAGQPPSHTHKLSLGIILILVPTYSKLWLTIKLILHFSPLRRRNIFFDMIQSALESPSHELSDALWFMLIWSLLGNLQAFFKISCFNLCSSW